MDTMDRAWESISKVQQIAKETTLTIVNCEEKINTKIKCSGIKTFFSPHDQGESLVRRMSIDTSTIIAGLNLSLKKFAFASLLMKFSHQTNSTTVNFRTPTSIKDKLLSDSLTTKHFPNANKRLSYEI